MTTCGVDEILLTSRRRLLTGILAFSVTLSNLRFTRAEPITASGVAAYVGLKLLDGAISYAGGEALRKALGRPTLSDVELWIRAAVDELKTFVSEELRRSLKESAVDEIRSELLGTRDNLYHYASLSVDNRGEYKYLIEDSGTRTARLLQRSLQYDQAYFVTTAAMAFRLFVLYTLYKIDKDAGHIESAKPTVDEVLKRLSESRDRIAYEMSPDRHYGLSCESEFIGNKWHDNFDAFQPNGNHQMLYTCYGTKDGNRITESYSTLFDSYGSLGNAEFDHVRKQVEEALAPHTEPLQRQTDTFMDHANWSLHAIYTCYRAMRGKVGMLYEYPEGMTPIEPGDMVMPSVVRMPGATVRASE